ncbi:Predicted small GTPase involved in nuclear protein import [Phaffia rhodozyma]|uniref:GTP-binding protein n=1 Tax=Phaffia rhodozyma TaxID=264483 RepID=A0A0F7SVF2_PHARH|nr:Predicted small GTPase involved in nuclear protein import [Phaffia rhodozyma]
MADSSEWIPVPDDEDPLSQKILLMGARRSGKTSAMEVLFHGMEARQTIPSVSPTHDIKIENVNIFAPYQIWDTPGSITAENFGDNLKKFSVLIYFVDMISGYTEQIQSIAMTFLAAHRCNPDMQLYLFINKADGITGKDTLTETFREIQDYVQDDMTDFSNEEIDAIPEVSFFLTSIYDRRLAYAFSQVIRQSLMVAQFLSGMMNSWVVTAQMDKSFLIDKKTKLYVATDGAPVQNAVYTTCVDWVTRIIAYEELYTSVVPVGQKTIDEKSEALFRDASDRTGNFFDAIDGYETESDSESEGGPESEERIDGEVEEVDDEEEDEDEDEDGEGNEDYEDYPSQILTLSSGITYGYWEITPDLALIGSLNTHIYNKKTEHIEESIGVVRKFTLKFLKAQRMTE